MTTLECICGDPFCISETVCKVVKNIASKIISIILITIQTLVRISEFTYGEVAELNNIESIQTFERVDAIHSNMDRTGVHLQERFQGVNDFLSRMESRLVKRLSPPSSSPVTPTPPVVVVSPSNPNITFVAQNGVGCDGFDQDGYLGPDNCEEDMFPPELSLNSCVSAIPVCDVDLCFDENFSSRKDAIAFLDAVLAATDDCANAEDVGKTFESVEGSVCSNSRFVVKPVQTFPRDSNCSETVLTGDPLTVEIGLDEASPSVSCGFRDSPFENDRRVSADGRTVVFSAAGSSSFVNTRLFHNVAVRFCRQTLDTTTSLCLLARSTCPMFTFFANLFVTG